MRLIAPLLETRSPIGLDLGSRCHKAVQLARRAGAWRIAAAAVVHRPEAQAPLEAAELEHLAGVLARRGFVGSELVLSAPPQTLRAEILELPPRASGAPLDELARAELARVARLEDDSFEMACWDLPAPARGGQTAHVMAVALPHADAEQLLDRLDACGWRTRALDCQAQALVRACAAVDPGEHLSAVIDLGWSRSLLVLAHRGVVLYQRQLAELTLSSLQQVIREGFGLEASAADHILRHWGLTAGEEADAAGGPERRAVQDALAGRVDALAREAAVSLTYAVHRYPQWPVRRALLCGGGARVPGLAARLAEGLGRAVEAVEFKDLCGATGPMTDRPDAALLVTAAGLALHGVSR